MVYNMLFTIFYLLLILINTKYNYTIFDSEPLIGILCWKSAK